MISFAGNSCATTPAAISSGVVVGLVFGGLIAGVLSTLLAFVVVRRCSHGTNKIDF